MPPSPHHAPEDHPEAAGRVRRSTASALVFKGVHKKNGKLQVTGLNKEYLGLVATDEEAVWDPAPLCMGQRAGRAQVGQRARDQASKSRLLVTIVLFPILFFVSCVWW
jgi:hypothetical protein